MKPHRTLKDFLTDETGFVSRDKMIVSGLVCSSLLWMFGEVGEGYKGHFNRDDYHANCVTNDGASTPSEVHHINETRHLNHTSNCY